MSKFSLLERIVSRPFQSAMAGAVLVLLVEVCRYTLDIRDGRMPLSLLSGAGQLLFLVALGEVIQRAVQKKSEMTIPQYIALAVVVGLACSGIIVRTAVGMYRWVYL